MWPAAYGPRVGGPDPADTPTNGGSRGAAPPGNLGIRTGQRPMIHRLQRCRGPRGPRASVTPAHRNSPRFTKKHGEPSAQLGWAAAPVPEAGVPQVREPTAPSVTERQPAWHGRMRLQEAPAVAPAPPQFWGGGDLDLLHFLHILSGGGWGRPAYPCIHASAGGSRGAPFVWGARAWIGFPIQSGPPRLAP